MRRSTPSRRALGALLGLILTTTVAIQTACAQAAPGQGPAAPSATGNTGVPASPATVVSTPAGPDGAMSQAELIAEVRRLSAIVHQLQQQQQQLSGGTAHGTPGADTGSAASNVAPSGMGSAGVPGQSLPPNPAPSSRFNSPATLAGIPIIAKFGPGFELKTDDDEYILQFHNLTQFDYRGYQQAGQATVKDGFIIPRQWWMFSGRFTKDVGFFTSIANSVDTLSLLDVFVDADFDPRLRLRAGRFKTPFTYEFFVEPIQGLVVPERSIFFNNFALNRDEGIMPYGRLFNGKVDYGVGMFNGTRNGYVPMQDGRVFAGLANYRPFGDEENSLLENLNIGGSFFAGDINQSPIPRTFRTQVPTTGNAVTGIEFLSLNNNVRQSGPMAFWDLHCAYYYQGLALIGEWESGFQNYALANNLNNRTQVPVDAFYLQASYLITGETRSSIGVVKPLKPVRFGTGTGSSGIGAIEPYFRYEYMDIGNQIFTSGFADSSLWANRIFATRLGVNWHLTQYMKMYFMWSHDEFNNPVTYAPGKWQKTSDLFMLRFQLYF